MTGFHDLDALRALAMLLVLVLHCLLFLVPDPHGRWPVQETWAVEVPGIYNPYVHLFLLIHGFIVTEYVVLYQLAVQAPNVLTHGLLLQRVR